MENSSKIKGLRSKKLLSRINIDASVSEIQGLNSKYSEILIKCFKEQLYEPMRKLIANMGPAELNEILILMLKMKDNSRLSEVPVELAEPIFDHVLPACSSAKEEDCCYLMMHITKDKNISRDVVNFFFPKLTRSNPITQNISLHAIAKIAKREQILTEDQRKTLERMVWTELSNPQSSLHLPCLECLFIDYVFTEANEQIVDCLMTNLEHLPQNQTFKILQLFVSDAEMADKVMNYLNFNKTLTVSVNESNDAELLNLINLIVRLKYDVPARIKDYLMNKAMSPNPDIIVELARCTQFCFLISQDAETTKIFETVLVKCTLYNPDVTVKIISNCLEHIQRIGIKVRYLLQKIDKASLTDSSVAMKYASLIADNYFA